MNQLISSLDEQFARLHARSQSLIKIVPEEKLYWQPRQSSGAFPVYSCGEHLLRSAAAVEQTFGGITANLWDDPFEWTLPESLDTPARIADLSLLRRHGAKCSLVKIEDSPVATVAKDRDNASGIRIRENPA